MRRTIMQLLYKLFYEREYTRLMATMQQAKWTQTATRADVVRMEYLMRLRTALFTIDAGGGI